MSAPTTLVVNKVSYSPSFEISNGTIEALKWIALFLMTLDHINKYIFNEKLPAMFEIGRIAMPLFGFVLAYNLARPNTLESGAYLRTMKRLMFWGVVSSPFFIALGGLAAGWWPLNIMFMLLLSTVILYLVEKGGSANIVAAIVVFLVGGAFVEFWWFALIFCLAAWWYCKTTSKAALFVWLLASASLYVVNRNLWALAAMPLILGAPFVQMKMPRFRYIFYAYYPLHLMLLLAIKYFLK